jgi:hypothetical protein
MNQNEKLLKEITSLKARLDELKEYFYSDNCIKCRNVESEIQGCLKQLADLTNLLIDQ